MKTLIDSEKGIKVNIKGQFKRTLANYKGKGDYTIDGKVYYVRAGSGWGYIATLRK